MFSRKADSAITVQVPSPGADHPSWVKVGVITALGFAVGVAWPRLMGFRVGPSLPETASSAVASASGAPVEPAAQAAAATTAAQPPAAITASGAAGPSAAPAAPAAVNVNVGRGYVFACKTAEGDTLKGKDCGSLPGLDAIVGPRLHKLTECPEAASASGKLHLVLHADFARGGLNADLGHGHGVASPDALLACAKTALNGVAFSGVPHDNPRYSIAYTVTFAGEATASETAGTATAPAAPSARTGGDEAADGSAQIVWDVAIVRDAPKTGKVVARLQRGTEIHVGAAKDGWYPIKFGDAFGSDGWVYRGAIGR